MAMNKTIKILLYANLFWYFGEGMLGPLFAVFTERIGGNILDITWAWATYLIVAGVLYVVFGKLMDTYHNKEKIMVWGFALNALFTFGYLFVSTPMHLFFVQAGLGVAVAMASPSWLSLYSENENKKEDGYEWGLVEGMGQILTGIAIILGGYIILYWSFTALFVIMGTIQTIATIVQARILKLKKLEKKKKRK